MQITPEHLTPTIERYIDDIINQKTGYNKDYECSVICVTRVIDRKPLRIAEGTGNVVFSVKYEAIVQKLINKEVVDGVISNVSNDGVIVDAGAWKNIHVSFKKVADCQFDEANNCYVDTDKNSGFSIKKGDKVRARLDVVNYHVNGITCMASIERAFSS
ncbi:DNA-directed RNA polymerase II 19 kD polypeptide rpb7, putative [Entamoeba invadens IP1]|uniref:DNA-directed RNA polymerase II 19 kD polypeptide rpb7, putative n=1 Tax=Entamoeba invadens IP1 TaxID=370355 RepID=A0A0A1U030_ENTIV|nr:DNA-directed RNA polymerase II 19 kD polypeptide rpb7, putative [Entamoeba invadens IP1]ELP87250.1 DNA-directed RNA polymerase II 19 kD polypeptide rpb7, putative [Entamoeba invadens IP1]|eukprot:XP_004254021.1 DNA-directed RNA polymerase II 19 kD polypeptide rpb7, putative [Entamoeba invadens IP1]